MAVRVVRTNVDASSPREPRSAHGVALTAPAFAIPCVPKPSSRMGLVNNAAPGSPSVPSARPFRARAGLTAAKTAIVATSTSSDATADARVDPLAMAASPLRASTSPSNTTLGVRGSSRHEPSAAELLGVGNATEPLQALAAPVVPVPSTATARPTAAERLPTAQAFLTRKVADLHQNRAPQRGMPG